MSVFRALLTKLFVVIEKLLAFASKGSDKESEAFTKVGGLYYTKGYRCFSYDNYLELSSDLRSTDNAEYIVKFQAGDSTYTNQCVFEAYPLVNLYLDSSKGILKVRDYSKPVDDYNSATFYTVYSGVSAGDVLYSKHIINGTSVSVSISKDGENWGTPYTYADAGIKRFADRDTYSAYNIYPIALGKYQSSTDYWGMSEVNYNGTIDITGCKVIINGELKFDGSNLQHWDLFKKEGGQAVTSNQYLINTEGTKDYSGFSGYNYLVMKSPFPKTMDSFEMVFAFTPTSSKAQWIYGYGDYYAKNVQLYLENNNTPKLTVYSNGTYNSVYTQIDGTTAITLNEKNYLKVTNDSTGLKLFSKSESETEWFLQGENANKSEVYFEPGQLNFIGKCKQDSDRYDGYPFSGTIHIGECYIKVNDEYVFKGDTATVSGLNSFLPHGNVYDETSDYALTNFKYSTSYINKVPVISPTDSLDMIFKVRTPTGFGEDSYSGYLKEINLLYTYSNYDGIRLHLDGGDYNNNYIPRLRTYMSSNGTNWDLQSGNSYNLTKGDILPATSYYFRLKWNKSDGIYKFGYSSTGLEESDFTWKTLFTNTTPVKWTSGFANIGYAAYNSDYRAENMIFYVNECSINVDGSKIWGGLNPALKVGDSVILNDGMAESTYQWEAYPTNTTKVGQFSLNSTIKGIEKDGSGKTVYEVQSIDENINEVEIQAGVLYHGYRKDDTNYYLQYKDSPHVSNNTYYSESGVISGEGFIPTTSGYLKTVNTFDVANYDSWEITTKIKLGYLSNYTSSSSYYNTVWTATSTSSSPYPALFVRNTGALRLYSTTYTNSSLTLNQGVWYYIRTRFTGTQYLVDVSTDNETWTNYITYNNSSKPSTNLSISFGRQEYSNRVFKGIISLKDSKITCVKTGETDETVLFDGSTALPTSSGDMSNTGCSVEEIGGVTRNISGFSSTGSVVISKPITYNQTSKIIIGAHLNDASTSQVLFAAADGSDSTMEISSSYGTMVFWSNNYGNIVFSNQLSSNTNYWFVYDWNGSNVNIYSAIDDGTYTLDTLPDFSDSMWTLQNSSMYGDPLYGKQLSLGMNPYSTLYWRSTIDLNKVMVVCDNTALFDGRTAEFGSGTYSDNGSIPTTDSDITGFGYSNSYFSFGEKDFSKVSLTIPFTYGIQYPLTGYITSGFIPLYIESNGNTHFCGNYIGNGIFSARERVTVKIVYDSGTAYLYRVVNEEDTLISSYSYTVSNKNIVIGSYISGTSYSNPFQGVIHRDGIVLELDDTYIPLNYGLLTDTIYDSTITPTSMIGYVNQPKTGLLINGDIYESDPLTDIIDPIDFELEYVGSTSADNVNATVKVENTDNAEIEPYTDVTKSLSLIENRVTFDMDFMEGYDDILEIDGAKYEKSDLPILTKRKCPISYKVMNQDGTIRYYKLGRYDYNKYLDKKTFKVHVPAESGPSIRPDLIPTTKFDMYLRGTQINWEALPEYQFSNTSVPGVYRLDGPINLTGEFKFGSSNWSSNDYGLYDSLVFNEPFIGYYGSSNFNTNTTITVDCIIVDTVTNSSPYATITIYTSDVPELKFTELFKTTSNVFTNSSTRFCSGYNGKVYLPNKTDSSVYSVDETGVTKIVDLTSEGVGTAIATDSVGNILVNKDFPNSGSSVKWTIISADYSTKKEIILSLPSGVSEARVDQIGGIVGDMLGDDGAYIYITPSGSSYIAAIKIVNGVQVSSETIPLTRATGSTSFGTQPVYTSVYDINELGTQSSVYQHFRSGEISKYNREGNVVEYINPSNLSNQESFGVITLNGVLYSILPVYTLGTSNRAASFSVTNMITGSELVRFDGLGASVTLDQFCGISTQQIDKSSAYIYFFVPSKLVAAFKIEYPVNSGGDIPVPENPTITYSVNGFNTYEEPVQCYHNDIVTYNVSCEHFVTNTGSYTMKYKDKEVDLPVMLTPLYTFTVNTTPEDAEVTLYYNPTSSNEKSIEVIDGTVIDWTVRKDGYILQKGSHTINKENYTENVLLESTSQIVALEDPVNIGNYGLRIPEDYVVKGEENKYLITEEIFPIKNVDTWELQVKYQATDAELESYPAVFGNRYNNHYSPTLYRYGSYFRLRIPKSLAEYWVDTDLSSITFKAFRWYIFRLGKLSDYTYYLDYSYSDDNVSWSDYTRAYTFKNTTIPNKELYLSSYMIFLSGYVDNEIRSSVGRIDLNETKLTIDGNVYWQAVRHFEVGDSVCYNSGIGKTDNTYTASYPYSSNVGTFTEYGKVVSIDSTSGQTLVTINPEPIEVVEATVETDIESTITTYGELPNSIVEIKSMNGDLEVNSEIYTESKLDNYDNSVFYGHIVNLPSLTGYTAELSLAGERVTYNDFPTKIKHGQNLTRKLTYNNKVVLNDSVRVTKDFIIGKNTFTVNCEQEGASIKIYGSDISTIFAYSGQVIEYEVSLEGYKPLKGTYTIPTDKRPYMDHQYSVNVSLNPYSTVDITSNVENSNIEIIVPDSVQVENSVKSLSGYISIKGTELLESNYYNKGCTITEVED